jgi:hypothetical protein
MLIDTLKQVQALLDKMIQHDRLNFDHSGQYLGEAGIDYVRDVLSLQGKIDYLLGDKK